MLNVCNDKVMHCIERSDDSIHVVHTMQSSTNVNIHWILAFMQNGCKCFPCSVFNSGLLSQFYWFQSARDGDQMQIYICVSVMSLKQFFLSTCEDPRSGGQWLDDSKDFASSRLCKTKEREVLVCASSAILRASGRCIFTCVWILFKSLAHMKDCF